MDGIDLPECQKCGEPAMLLFYHMWLCGPCMVKIHEKKLDEARRLVEE